MSVETITLIQGNDKIELPREDGNWVLAREVGYSPVQMLVSAVAACGGYVYQSVLDNSHIPYTFEKIEVSYTRNEERQAQPVQSIAITFFVEISDELHEKAERCVKLVSKNCPVIQSLDPAIEVTEKVKFI